MSKVFAVIRREFVTRVSSRAFIIGTLLAPVLMAALFVLPILLGGRDTGPKRIAIVDAATGQLGARLEAILTAASRGKGEKAKPRYLVSRVRRTDGVASARDSLLHLMGRTGNAAASLDGMLLVDDSVLASGKLVYLGTNVGSPGDMNYLEALVQPAVQGERLEAMGVNPAIAMQATAPVDLDTRKVSDGKVTGDSGQASFLLAYIMSFLLYMALIIYGMQVMGAVVEEKTNRIMEVLVSSLTPFELLLGKVLGVGAVGLLQVGLWAGTATFLSGQKARIANALGAPEMAGGFSLPTMSPQLLAVFLTFFVLGFLLYSAAYAAIGAMCSSDQETRQAQSPVTMCILAGLLCMFALVGEPNGSLAKALSLVPLVAPFVTPVRYSLDPMPISEVLLSAFATTLGLIAVVWVASRIYRVGILSYGKKPSLAEVWRWIRTA